MLLKILQQLVTFGSGDIVSNDIFNQIPKLSSDEYEKTKANIDLNRAYKSTMQPKTLGSASLAQVHRCTIPDPLTKTNIDGVVKFIKPYQFFYFLCEIDVLLTRTWSSIRFIIKKKYPEDKDRLKVERLVAQTRQMLLFFVKMFASEFNYYQEAYFTAAGYKLYNQPMVYGKRRLDIRSVNVVEVTMNPLPALVVSLATGFSLNDLSSIVENKSKAERKEMLPYLAFIMDKIDTLFGLWIATALLGTGFFHADLHPGNIFVPTPETYDSINNGDIGDSEDCNLTIIDYGSSGKLVKQQRCGLININLVLGKIQKSVPTFGEREGRFESTRRDRHGKDQLRKVLCYV